MQIEKPDNPDQPSESKQEYGTEADLLFKIEENQNEQKKIEDFLILEQKFLVINPSNKDIELNDFVARNTVEKLYTNNPVKAFDDNVIRSKRIQAETSTGKMPCIVASEGKKILKAGETIEVSICVRVPRDSSGVVFLNEGKEIGRVQCKVSEENDPCNPTKEIGETIDLLRVEATVTVQEQRNNQIQYYIKVFNEKTTSLYIDQFNFKVTVKNTTGEITEKHIGTDLQMDSSLRKLGLEKEDSCEGGVQVVFSRPLKSGDTVIFTYVPDSQYAEYSMNWIYTAA